jgi:formylglycine-generating enzyme required for sulfatase activity
MRFSHCVLAGAALVAGVFAMNGDLAAQQRALEEAKAANDRWAIERVPTEAPPHPVKITRPFYLGKCEVTQAQWQAVMGNNSSLVQDLANPVEMVSWDDIQPFLAKLNGAGWDKRSDGPPNAGAQNGGPALRLAHPTSSFRMKYALPTEAQWEYACRAGTTTAFCFGGDAGMRGQYAWSESNSGHKPHPVGGLKPNAWGLLDMHGNLWEWCADWWTPDYYAQSPPTDPPGPMAGSNRVHRGGSHSNRLSDCRSATRCDCPSDYSHSSLGFRLALVPADE